MTKSSLGTGKGGTNRGRFLGFEPTNKQVTAIGIDIFRLANGKIVEQWASPNLLGAAVQLELISLPGVGH